MSRKPFRLLLALALVAGACSSATDEADPTTASTSAPASTAPAETSTTATSAPPSSTTTTEPESDDMVEFDRGRCPFSAPIGTDPDCGTVTVPQDRDNPDGRQIELAVAVFPATSEDLQPPMIYLEGGPGGEILEAIEFAYPQLFEVLNEDRTIVVFDQRGTGYTDPSLVCDEADDLTYDLLDELVDLPDLIELRLDALAPCLQRWADDGILLEHYNSAASAQDVADIKNALDYDVVDIFGISYGTRLALTVMRDAPDGVRSVILDSTYPPEIDGVASIPISAARAFGELYAACAADPACDDAYGDVETLLFDVVDQHNDEPADVLVTDLFTRDAHDAVVDGDTILGLVFQSLYSEDLFVSVPEMLLDAQNGEYRRIEQLLSLFLANQHFFALGQNLSVQCHEEVPYGDPAAVDAASADYPRLAPLVEGALTQSAYAFEFCPWWGSGTGAPIENEPVVSDIPTLVVGGQFDPITPPSFGRDVAARLSNGYFVEYPGLGHGVAVAEGCPIFVTLEFLDDPLQEPDSSCASRMGPPEFTVFAPSEGALPLVTQEVELLGVVTTVEVPEGWEHIGFGAFYRDAEGIDETAILVQGYADEGLIDLLVAQFGADLSDDGELDEIDPLTVDGRTWRRFTETAFGLRVEMAMYAGEGSTLVVALFVDDREHDQLFEHVFLPALESVELDT